MLPRLALEASLRIVHQLPEREGFSSGPDTDFSDSSEEDSSLPPSRARTASGGNSPGFRNRARLAVSAGEKLRQAMQDIRAVAQQYAWQVIDPQDIQAQPTSSPTGFGVAADTAAILVPVLVEKEIPRELLTWLAYDVAADAPAWLEDAAAPAPPKRPPVIAVLFAIEELSDDDGDGVVLRTQKELLDGGADATVIKPSFGRELRLSIRAALAQVHATRKAAARAEDDLRQRIAPHIQQLKTVVAEQRKATSAANEAAREAMGMFWQASHLLLRGFPALDTDLSARLGEGERLGPLRLHGRLGHGTFGTVLAATKEATKEKEAVKVIEKDGISDVGHVRTVWKEIHFLQTLKHENIVAYYGALQGPDHIYIRMELVAGGNLYRSLKASGDRFCVSDAQRCQAQLSSAIQYCHGMHVAHCDLKPENLGLCNCTPLILKVLDFGSARRTDSECGRTVGTIPFMAPEVLEASSAAPFEPAGSDNFACGVILLEMLCGIGKLNAALGWPAKVRPSPALAAELRDLLRDSAGLAAALEEDVGVVQSELHRLLAGLLRENPKHRWSAAKALRSSWLQQGLVAEAVSR